MTDTPPQATPRFEVRPTSDSHFGWIRTRLSMERTLMSWVRTGVSLIGFGFTIVQFFQRLADMPGVQAARRPAAPRTLGLMLIGAGVIAMAISGWQYRQLVRYLWSPQFHVLAGLDSPQMKPVMTQTPVLFLVVAVALIGAFAFFAVFTRLV
jgi:putative membrane protein